MGYDMFSSLLSRVFMLSQIGLDPLNDLHKEACDAITQVN